MKHTSELKLQILQTDVLTDDILRFIRSADGHVIDVVINPQYSLTQAAKRFWEAVLDAKPERFRMEELKK